MAGLAVAVLVASCDSTPTDPAPTESLEIAATETEAAAAEVPHEPLVFGEPDRSFLQIARERPTFAGAYIEDASVHVRSTDGSMPEGVDPQAIAAVDLPVQARGADHSWETLARWHRAVYEALTASDSPPWASLTISSRENRVVVGTPDRQAVREALKDIDVPTNVFKVVYEELALPTAASADGFAMNKTLRDSIRPVLGGVDAHWQLQEDGCTLGFNVEHWEFGRSFVTPTHCTETLVTVTDATFRQPASSVPVIGTEVFDHHGLYDDCPDGFRCRFSDAALIQYDADVDYELGKIARPVAENEIEVVEDDPYLIDFEKLTIVEGSPLQWVGRTTGLRKGTVKDTCSTINKWVEDFLILWCQHKHSEAPGEGDSGGPVFRVQADGITVQLAGIIIGRRETLFSTKAWFSPLSGIRMEIKPNSNLECDGLGTTLNGSCGEPSGSSGGDGCEDDPFGLDPVC